MPLFDEKADAFEIHTADDGSKLLIVEGVTGDRLAVEVSDEIREGLLSELLPKQLARFELDGEIMGARADARSILCIDGGFMFSSQCDTEAAALKDVEKGPIRVVVQVFRREG